MKKRKSAGAKRTCGQAYFSERKCPECGKEFWVQDFSVYAYKINGVPICSWHCLRSAEKRRESAAPARKSKSGNVRLRPGQKELIIRMAEQGKGPAEIGRELSVSQEVVYYHIRENRKKKAAKGG